MDEKRLRALAHAHLRFWAVTRAAAMECLGTDGLSVAERMRRRAHGGSAGTKPGTLTAPERMVGAYAKTFRVEQAVRQLPLDQRAALTWKYLSGKPLSLWAARRGVTLSAASRMVHRAMVAVGYDLEHGYKLRADARAAREELLAVA